MTAKVLTRADLPESDKWDLTHLFANADKWTEDFAWLQRTYAKIADWKGCLGKSAGSLAQCLEFEKSIDGNVAYNSRSARVESSRARAVAMTSTLSAILRLNTPSSDGPSAAKMKLFQRAPAQSNSLARTGSGFSTKRNTEKVSWPNIRPGTM